MITIKCKICGGDVQLSNDKTFGVCEYCGSSITMPKIDDEQRAAAFDRGNHFRRIGEFDKALAVYERIVNEDYSDAEAHWCCALCRFGIEYVEDPTTYEWLPTCHRASFDNFLEDVDYLAAVEHSDSITRRQYQKDAAKIAEVQRRILVTSQKEEPFDVFICYKESDENGQRTVDSTLAQDIYYQLTDRGRRVFFARITLENKGGAEYEPYIFAALNSARVMVVVGTSAENFNAVWVKNEWSRFLSLLKKDHTKLLLPCYRDMDPYDLPDQLSVLQSYDMSKIGFVQDLIRGIDRVLDADKVQEIKQETVILQSEGNANVIALVKRGNMALEDNDWNMADNFFDRALDMDAECAEAYLGKALSEFKAASLNELQDILMPDTSKIKPRQVEASIIGHEERENNLVESNQIPGYLSREDLRKCFSYNLAYYASADEYKGEMDNKLNQLSDNKSFIRAEKYARNNLKTEIVTFKDSLKNRMDQKLSAIRDNDERFEEKVHEAYEQAFTEWEKKVARMRFAAETRRQSDYNLAVECFEKNNYESALQGFQAEGVAEYLDSSEYIERCKDLIAEQQMKLEIEANKKEKKRGICMLVAAVSVIAVVTAISLITEVVIPEWNYYKAERLMDDGEYADAAKVFEELGDYRDAEDRILNCYYQQALAFLSSVEHEDVEDALESDSTSSDAAEQISKAYYYILACESVEAGEYETAAHLFSKAGDYQDAEQRALSLWSSIRDYCIISAGNKCTVALKRDGTVVAVGRNRYGQCDVTDWEDIVSISVGKEHTVGLKSNGTVIATGINNYGQCEVYDWYSIVEISAGLDYTVGLKLDGTVLAVGSNEKSQCDVEEWEEVVAVSAGYNHTIGLKSDGTVVATGSNESGQCNVSGWSNIIAISVGNNYTVGLKSDGTVVAVGKNEDNQCDVSDWTEIVAISAGYEHTVGLKQDGTVVAVGVNEDNQCDVSEWTDIVAISAGNNYTVGLKSDGTVIAIGDNEDGQCDVSDWADIKIN